MSRLILKKTIKVISEKDTCRISVEYPIDEHLCNESREYLATNNMNQSKANTKYYFCESGLGTLNNYEMLVKMFLIRSIIPQNV